MLWGIRALQKRAHEFIRTNSLRIGDTSAFKLESPRFFPRVYTGNRVYRYPLFLFFFWGRGGGAQNNWHKKKPHHEITNSSKHEMSWLTSSQRKGKACGYKVAKGSPQNKNKGEMCGKTESKYNTLLNKNPFFSRSLGVNQEGGISMLLKQIPLKRKNNRGRFVKQPILSEFRQKWKRSLFVEPTKHEVFFPFSFCRFLRAII
jgi:hypothetical protein